ncbi:MAG TPA: VOC family protein [Candidatus Obscuribacterales bacterium]
MPVSTNVKLKTLSYVILYVKDTAKAVTFYRDTLGLKVLHDSEGWVELETDGPTKVCLHGDPELKPNSTQRTCVCFSVDDIQETYETLKAKGVKFVKEPHVVCEAEGKTGKSADFYDEDGNFLSVFGYTK